MFIYRGEFVFFCELGLELGLGLGLGLVIIGIKGIF